MHANMIKINEKLNDLSADQIKEIISSLMGTYGDEVEIVLGAALDALEGKVNEAEFIEFMDSL